MKNYIYIFMLFISLNSCNHKTQIYSANENIFLDTIPNAKEYTSLDFVYDKIDFNNVIKNIDEIKLETNSKCLISRIDEVKLSDDKFFIADYQLNKLFVFSGDGKHLSTIDDRGKANNEYIRFTSFDINHEQKLLYLLDGDNGKILVYDFNSVQQNIIKLPYKWVNHIALIEDSIIALEFGFRSPNVGVSSNVIVYDYIQKKETLRCFNFIKEKISFLHKNLTSFSTNNSQVYYWSLFGNSIYNINRDSVQKLIKLDFDKSNTPSTVFNHKFSDASKIIRDNHYSYITKFYDFKNWLYFGVTRGASPANIFYNKDTQKFSFANYTDMKNFPNILLPTIFKISDQIFCGVITPELYVRYASNSIDVSIEDNPILFIYTLK